MFFVPSRGCAGALPSFERLGRRGDFCFLFSRLSCPIVQVCVSLGVEYRWDSLQLGEFFFSIVGRWESGNL